MQHDFLAETMEVDLLPAFIEYLDAVYFRGYADLVRARGENNYYNAMAQVYWEQAGQNF